MSVRKGSPLRAAMQAMGRFLPADKDGENARAVRMIARATTIKDLLGGGAVRRAVARARGQGVWPVTSGTYTVGDPTATVAVCTLTSDDLVAPLARLPGVAIAGRLYTVNLGIEKIILNVTANPAIRVLVLCGKESPVFHPAQGLRALITDGVDAERRIIGAAGHLPVLRNVPLARIERFRQQVELADATGELDLVALEERVRALADHARRPVVAQRAEWAAPPVERAAASTIRRIRPGGHRQPLVYDPKGFFVITLDRDAGEIILCHYLPDNAPAHEMRGRAAEAMVLGLIRENLISQLSHAGYLGAELAKAEAALRLGARYEQDRPLSPRADGDREHEGAS